jgi:hypothetical protein
VHTFSPIISGLLAVPTTFCTFLLQQMIGINFLDEGHTFRLLCFSIWWIRFYVNQLSSIILSPLTNRPLVKMFPEISVSFLPMEIR